MMKKLTLAILALALLCTAVSCGGKADAEDNKPILGEANAEIGGAEQEPELLLMEAEQRLSAAYEALDAAYASGDEGLIAELEAEVRQLQEDFERLESEMDYGGNAGGAYEYPDEDDVWEDDGWDDPFAVDEMHDERLFGVDWYYVSEDVCTYHIKAYGYGDYQKHASYSIYDPSTGTTESYSFFVTEGYANDPGNPSVSIVYTAIIPEQDLQSGASYADEIWHMVYVDGDMELRRYTVNERGYAGDFIDSTLFTTTRPG